MNDINITAYGATDFVGRSSFLIHDRDHKILLDCGLELVPKQKTRAPVGVHDVARELDSVLISHAHIDHSGYTPRLSKEGYRGNYYMTQPTKDIAYRLWLDHLKIEGRRHWSESDLDRVFHKISTKEYNKKFKVADGITAEFIHAGHILGAAQILLDWEGQLILYTGDINDRVTPMFDGYDLPNEKVDVLITESTNGDRYVPERKKIDVGLRLIAKQVAEKGNKMLLPSFAVGRSQETLITLALDEDLDDIPVYIDGMIVTMNMITEHFLSEKWVSKGFLENLKDAGLNSPFEKQNMIPVKSISERSHQSRKYLSESRDGSIIVTTSGMIEGGPIHTYLDLLGADEDNVMGFSGYQVEGTTGRKIYDGASNVTLFEDFGRKKDVDLNLKIMKFPYSGHTSVDGLKQIMGDSGAKNIFLVHGDKRNQKYIMEYVKDVAKPSLINENTPTRLIGV